MEEGGLRGSLVRICRLDGGGDGFYALFFLAQVAYTVVYLLIFHFTLSSTSTRVCR